MVCAVIAFSVSAAPQKIDFGKLPKNSQEFIQKNFPTQKVKTVEMDREASWDKYTVYFTDGSQVSFEGGNGDWSQIDMKVGTVPATVLPVKIKSDVAKKYPLEQIKLLETTADGYKVKLTDGSFLYYDKDGNLTNITK